VTAMAASG